MLRNSISNFLSQIPLHEYISEVHGVGRLHLSREIKEKMASPFQQIENLLETSVNLNAHEYKTLKFARNFCDAANQLNIDPLARYPAYTNLRVLDEYLGVNSRLSLQETFERCRLATRLLLRDWLEFEQNSYSLEGSYHKKGLDTRAVAKRILLLREFEREFPTGNVPHIAGRDFPKPSGYDTYWDYFACEHDGAASLIHGTCLPQSIWHDEYLFMRTTHITEVFFWGIISGLRGASKLISDGNLAEAIVCIGESNLFTEKLSTLYKIFNTMPVESFAEGFRGETGNSSAIQSVKFQTIDLLARGFSLKKVEALKMHQDHTELLEWDPDPSMTLSGMLQITDSIGSSEAGRFRNECEKLSKNLMNWRGTHMALVTKYLSIDVAGTGGEGYNYLMDVKDTPLDIHRDDSPHEEKTESQWITVSDLAGSNPNTTIAALKVKGLTTGMLLEIAKGLEEEIIDWIAENSPKIDSDFSRYDQIFAKHGMEFPPKAQKLQFQKEGIYDNKIANLVVSLEIKFGLLLGLHQCSSLREPLTVSPATTSQTFVNWQRTKFSLSAGELIFSDQKNIFACYCHGSNRKSMLKISPNAASDEPLGDILFLILSPPGHINPALEKSLIEFMNIWTHISEDVLIDVINLEVKL